MGNNCKSFEKMSHSYESHFERTHYKSGNHYKPNLSELCIELPRDVTCAEAQRFSTSELDSTGTYCPPFDMRTAELVRICLRNRPAGVSDVDWERFLSSVCFEYSQNDAKCGFDTSAGIKTAIWATPSPRSPSRSNANMNSRRSSCGDSEYSSVEFAGRYVLPYMHNDKTNALSSSLSSMSGQSQSRGQSERSHAKCFVEDSSDTDLGSVCDEDFNSGYTYRLGDLPCKSCEDYKSFDENKISSKASSEKKISPCGNSTFTDPGVSLSEEVDVNLNLEFFY